MVMFLPYSFCGVTGLLPTTSSVEGTVMDSVPGGTDSHILTPAGELWVEGVTDGRLQPSGLPGTHYVRKLVTAF